MNSVPPKVLDFWLARALLLAEEQKENMEPDMMTPENLAKQLGANHA